VCEALADRGEERDEHVAVHFLDTEPAADGAVKRLPRLASFEIVSADRWKSARALAVSPGLMRRFAALDRPIRRSLGARGSVLCLLMAARVERTLRATQSTRVVAHHAGIRGLASLLAAPAVGARVTVFIHGAEWGHEGWRGLEPVITHVCRNANHVIANSQYTAGLCTDATSRTAIDIIHPGVDHERFFPVPDVRSDRAEFVVLFVGHLHPRKGPVVLARAFPSVRAPLPVRAVFAGPDRGQADAVRRAVEAGGVADRVEIRGAVPDDDLPDLYRAADVVVFPTVWRTEGFGLVAAEAMACGTAVVASRVGAIPEVVEDGVTGLLVTPDDEQDLARGISRVLSDEPLRRRLGEAGAARSQRFQWSTFADALLADLRSDHELT
jgi:glycosyltransferase involved in cell wall biosynthesis